MRANGNLGYSPTIRELPQGERPRERLKEYGAKHLSNTELVAILLRTGLQGENVLSLSSKVLMQFGGLAGLGRSTIGELCAVRGLSEAKACQILAALELGRRSVSQSPEERVVINSPQDVANLLMGEMSLLEQEHLRVLLLNTKNEVMKIQEIYVGNVNSSVVRPAEVIRPAVRENAPSISSCTTTHRATPRPARKTFR